MPTSGRGTSGAAQHSEAAPTQSRSVEAGAVGHAGIQPDRPWSTRARRRHDRDRRQRDQTILRSCAALLNPVWSALVIGRMTV
jgi:hypothetical protein